MNRSLTHSSHSFFSPVLLVFLSYNNKACLNKYWPTFSIPSLEIMSLTWNETSLTLAFGKVRGGLTVRVCATNSSAGDVKLTGLQLKREALEKFELPIEIHQGISYNQ